MKPNTIVGRRNPKFHIQYKKRFLTDNIPLTKNPGLKTIGWEAFVDIKSSAGIAKIREMILTITTFLLIFGIKIQNPKQRR